MTDEQLNALLNEIFFDFEKNHFTDEGNWPRKVNLIFAFADYIDELQDCEISQILRSNDKKLINRFRHKVKIGIDAWLKENMKTLMF